MRNVIVGLAVAGLLFLGAGLWVGLGPVTAGSLSCGSAWSPNYAAADREESVDRLAEAMSGGRLPATKDHRQLCAAAYGSRSGLGIMLTLVAAAAGGAAAVMYGQERQRAAGSAAGDQVEG